MTDYSQTSKYDVALRFGWITGILYAVLLFLRYRFFASNPRQFGLSALIAYVLILLMYLFTGITRKKELGGYVETKEIFQAIFIVILIMELVFIVFNLIYLRWIDPLFWEKFKSSSMSFYQHQKMTVEQRDLAMKGVQDADQQTKPMGLVKGFGYSVIVDSIFGFMIAAVLRKKRPVVSSILDQPKS
jgi:Protein of unknown function (DUF4199)